MKELRLLAIIICVLQSMDFVETDCTHPFGTGTFISSTRGTLTMTNTTIGNYKFLIGYYKTTITLTCYTQNDTNRYVFFNNFQVFNNVFLKVYTCLDIRNSTSDRHYVYEATVYDKTGDYFTADSTNVCTRVNYLTAVETTIVIRQGAYSRSMINCPNIILGNYTYNTTDDYSDMDSCNSKQQLTFNKDRATYLALSSGGNLACMYSGTGDYVYLITFNNDVSVDSKNTYQFTCFAFSFSGYGSVVYASQRPISCSSSQTPTSADSTEGKTFIFTPYVRLERSRFQTLNEFYYITKVHQILLYNIIFPNIYYFIYMFTLLYTYPHFICHSILDTSIESKAAVDLDWVFVSSRKPIIKLEEGRDSTQTPSPPPSIDRGMTQFDLQIETPSVQSFKEQCGTGNMVTIIVSQNQYQVCGNWLCCWKPKTNLSTTDLTFNVMPMHIKNQQLVSGIHANHYSFGIIITVFVTKKNVSLKHIFSVCIAIHHSSLYPVSICNAIHHSSNNQSQYALLYTIHLTTSLIMYCYTPFIKQPVSLG
ncbi:hypothetical protein ACJMK2_032613 [Sinanodonta woodiana]|uniref:Uncharacterized protein n=1 Tax=Sinanodonta woodiana TaxID=1069815 RepID=A0ABD3X296_SINWO